MWPEDKLLVPLGYRHAATLTALALNLSSHLSHQLRGDLASPQRRRRLAQPRHTVETSSTTRIPLRSRSLAGAVLIGEPDIAIFVLVAPSLSV